MKHVKLFFALFAMLALGVGNAWSETITLNNLGAGLSSTSNTTLSTTVVGDYTLNYLQGKKQGNSILLAKGTNGGTSFISNKTPIPGAIQSVTVYINTGASGKTTYHCAFSTTECTSKYVTGSTAENITGGNNHKYTCSVENASYFCVALGNNNNGQVLKLEIEYTPAASGGDVIVKTLKSIAVEGMTTNYETGDIFKFNGTCTATYSVTKNDVAQEDETKVVTPTSVSTPDMTTAGEKEVTVTYTEDEVTVTATYTINVTENSIYPGIYALALNNTFFGCGTGNNETEQVKRSDDILVTAGCLSTASSKTYYHANHVRFYADSYLKFSVPEGYVINSIVFAEDGTWNGSITVDVGTYTDGTKTWAGSAQEVVFSFAAQNRIATATVTYAEAGDTPEVPTLDAPTFDLEEGTYNEAKEVNLSAEEGTIYYTLDGTAPDAESIEYTTPIVLDECGTTTINAIAISGEITSSVASATYTIKLPLNNSQANPYTEDEAIEVYNGGCYDNQEVYVKGVVANAQFYSSNTYTITLEGGFLFYKFYEAADEVTFTEDYIVAGDTLVACGKLVKFGETYELGAGCYLVDRKPYSEPKVDISNTPETAYTVAEAIALIDDITSDLTKGVYVKGQISEVESYNEKYGNITYWIQDAEGNKFECYGGLGLNQATFTSINDLVVGSQVVVYGVMKKHNSTYEFNYNNYIVSLTLPSYTVTVTVNDAAMGSVQGLAAEGTYEHGAEVTLTATPAFDYEFEKWSNGATENPLTITVENNIELQAIFAEVAATEVNESGKFSISAHKTATFATGNLQYHTSDKTWRFAKQQYQVVGEQNIEVGNPDFKGWIDMFGWSTSETYFGVDPSNSNELYDGEFVDWGKVFEGENWSTLSADEWKYLLNTRANATQLKQIATIDTILGIMLFPDAWVMPEGIEVAAKLDTNYNVNVYNYTVAQWDALEDAGAIFLPAAGRRTGGYGNMINYDQQVETREDYLVNGGFYRWQDNTNIYCYYWTSTINEDKNVSYLHNIVALGNDEYTIGTGAIWGEKGRYGQSVRLAKVAYDTHTVEVTAENGTVEGAGTYEYGATATLTAVANDGYEFLGWTVDDKVVSTDESYTFEVTSDMTLVANFVEVEPEVIAYELNGGELPLVGPTNAELWEMFKPYYNQYYLANGKLKEERNLSHPIENATTFADSYMMEIMTDEASEYKWLGDYVARVTADADRSLDTEVLWRFGVAAFFNCSPAAASTWNGNADFTEAGKPENWVNVYPDAQEVVLPTNPVAEDYVLPTPTKTGCTFVGWYDNAEGTGEAYTVIPAGWSGTLYAIWKQSPTVALENVTIEGQAAKAIINGQLIIIKNGVQYNAQGQVVK